MFENRVLRRMFGPKKYKVTWNGEHYIMWSLRVYDPYSLPNIFRVRKSRRMRWAGHVARMMESSIQGFGGET